MFNLFKKKPKQTSNSIMFYGVTDLDVNIENIKPDDLYTITPTMMQALEYLAEYYFVEHYDHYLAWCNIHEKDPDISREDYLLEMNPNLYENKKVIELFLEKDSICSILRMAYKCPPVACNFITKAEFDFYETIMYANGESV